MRKSLVELRSSIERETGLPDPTDRDDVQLGSDSSAQSTPELICAPTLPRDVLHFSERETGLEPATSSLGSWHSTTELLPQA